MLKISKRKRLHQGGWAWVIPAITAAASYFGAKGTNETNVENQEKANEFNAEQATIQRNWSAQQADEAQYFSAEQAAKEREFNATQAQLARNFNAQEATAQRMYASQMANTTYQRAVGDMRKAGLNPMLAYSQGGAPAPQGTAASGPAASAGSGARGSAPSGAAATANAARVQNEVAAGLASAAQVAQIKNIDADTELKKAAATREEATATGIAETTKKTTQEILEVRERIQLTMKQTWNETTRGNLMEAQRLLTVAQKRVQDGQLDVQEAEVALRKIEEKLKQAQLPEAEAYAEKFSGRWGGNVTPYMREIIDILRVLIYGRIAPAR